MPNELLLEIGHEEIPASYMGPALSQIKEMAQKFLNGAGFSFSKITAMGTPRRMVLCVENLEMSEKNQGVELLERSSTPNVVSELAKILPKIILGISFSKSMRWHNYEARFARPLRWIVSLYGGKVVNFEFEGIKPDKFSYGHRFLAPSKFEVKDFAQYKQELKNKFVIVDHKERKNLIKAEVEEVAQKSNAKIVPDEKLLEIVNWLVEWPVVLLGSFKKEFLALPKEVLMTSMRSHQKYFSLTDARENLLPHFITISNMKVENPKMIVQGNEKVLTARLTDAQFLYNADKKISLGKMADKLKAVTFAEKLGSMDEKTERIIKLADFISILTDRKVRPTATRAASLCKADLVSEMVGEFPDLQGTIGKYYAQLSGEKAIVAQAIGEHYLPRHAQDILPQTKEGAIVSLADKLDSVVGYFSLGLVPTATEDPYALRRQILGVLQIIWNKEFYISLDKLIGKSLDLYGQIAKNKKKIKTAILKFLRVRLENILESKKVSKQIIESVLSLPAQNGRGLAFGGGFDNLLLVKKRITALTGASSKKEFQEFKSAMKRILNILGTKPAKKSVNAKLLKEQAEKDLQKMVLETEKIFAKKMKEENYQDALAVLIQLAPFVNKFFDGVLVMAKEKRIKDNRLALLSKIYFMAQEIADFRKII